MRARATKFIEEAAARLAQPLSETPMSDLIAHRDAIKIFAKESKHPFEFVATFVSALPLPRRTPPSILASITAALDRLESPASDPAAGPAGFSSETE